MRASKSPAAFLFFLALSLSPTLLLIFLVRKALEMSEAGQTPPAMPGPEGAVYGLGTLVLIVVAIAGLFAFVDEIKTQKWAVERERREAVARVAAERQAGEVEVRRQQDELKRQQRAREHEVVLQERFEARLASLPSVIAAQAQVAVRELESAARRHTLATSHFRDRLYSPLWETLEAGFSDLWAHHASVSELRNLTRELGDLASQAPARGVVPPGVDELTPPTSEAADRVEADLTALFSTAQGDFQFASIYEQRRTTAAVIAGFASLSEAVSSLAGQIQASYGALHSSLEVLVEQGATARSDATSSANILDTTAHHYAPGSLGYTFTEMTSHLKSLAARSG